MANFDSQCQTVVHISILTSCTSKKAITCKNPITAEDFDQGTAHVQKREKTLAEYTLPAGQMYVGQQHQHLMQGVRALRRKRPEIEVDVKIISAGYGLISEDRPIAPYERAFSNIGKKGVRALADRLNIPQDARRFLACTTDMILVLLGSKYVQAIDPDDTLTFGGPALLFCSREAERAFPDKERVKKVIVTRSTAKRFSEGLVWLKGYLARRLLLRMIEQPGATEEALRPEVDVLDMLFPDPAQTGLEL